MNLSEMRQLYRDIYPAPDTRFFTNPEVNRYLNLGHRRFVEETKIMTGEFSTDLVSGQSDYSTLTLPHLEISRVAITDSTGNKFKLRFVPLAELDDLLPTFENADSSIPAFYYFRHNQLLSLFPKPSFSVTGGLKAIVVKIPADLILDVSIPTYPRVYHEAPIFYALHIGKLKDQEFAESQQYLARFKEIAARAKRDLERVNGDLPGHFRTQEIVEFLGGRKR